ncbi:hypothetical protein [Herbaspirillum sp. GW103]|uniref:hypothetical protein n=1 Tax=Herbaspirillum sp. GW103 TaxID=1175306 RepID=UPI00054D5918|nr:hypothetical protein [Herbaspirillum sp. GW103]
MNRQLDVFIDEKRVGQLFENTGMWRGNGGTRLKMKYSTSICHAWSNALDVAAGREMVMRLRLILTLGSFIGCSDTVADLGAVEKECCSDQSTTSFTIIMSASIL